MNFKWALFIVMFFLSEHSHALYGSRTASPDSSLQALATLHLSDAEKPEYDFFCSGVLIAPDKVLTTGHCIEVMATEVYEQWNIFAYQPELMKVKLAGVKYAVADVIIAPSYFEAAGYEGEDLAIIKLKKPSLIKPLKISPTSGLVANTAVTMVARGKIAETKITSVKNFGKNKIIFTDGSRAGICAGDSGGALLVKVNKEFQLAGLLSADIEGCEKHTGVSVRPRIFE